MSDNERTTPLAGAFHGSVNAEVEAMIEDYDLEGEPFDFDLFTNAAEHVLDARSPGSFTPPEDVYWRAVLAELRRRATGT